MLQQILIEKERLGTMTKFAASNTLMYSLSDVFRMVTFIQYLLI